MSSSSTGQQETGARDVIVLQDSTSSRLLLGSSCIGNLLQGHKACMGVASVAKVPPGLFYAILLLGLENR
jgi:hypothetical protein